MCLWEAVRDEHMLCQFRQRYTDEMRNFVACFPDEQRTFHSAGLEMSRWPWRAMGNTAWWCGSDGVSLVLDDDQITRGRAVAARKPDRSPQSAGSGPDHQLKSGEGQ